MARGYAGDVVEVWRGSKPWVRIAGEDARGVDGCCVEKHDACLGGLGQVGCQQSSEERALRRTAKEERRRRKTWQIFV
eukprot:4723134-Pleurochrysis_carterae.AAC.1